MGNSSEPCIYRCEEDGGCQVRYAGPAQSGSTVGNCFSALFGGGCHGTPAHCRDCNTAVKVRAATLYTVLLAVLSVSHTFSQSQTQAISQLCNDLPVTGLVIPKRSCYLSHTVSLSD